MKYDVELTDTFGGEANYSWVRRATIEASDKASTRALVRRAKKALGSSYCRGNTTDHGDLIRHDFRGMCMVMFITPAEEDGEQPASMMGRGGTGPAGGMGGPYG